MYNESIDTMRRMMKFMKSYLPVLFIIFYIPIRYLIDLTEV